MARRLKLSSPSLLNKAVKMGCPVMANGQFDPVAVEDWFRKRKEKREESQDLREQKLQAEIDRIQRDIRQRDHDYEQTRGEVHSKAECCKSLTAVVSEAMQPLMSLHTQVKAAFPELPQNVIDAIAGKVDAAMEQIRSGLK
jgi:chromosome segregation ATPase